MLFDSDGVLQKFGSMYSQKQNWQCAWHTDFYRKMMLVCDERNGLQSGCKTSGKVDANSQNAKKLFFVVYVVLPKYNNYAVTMPLRDI